MIGVQRYPLEHAPYDRTPKTLAFKAAAEERGLDWFLPAARGHVRATRASRRASGSRSRRSGRTSTAARGRPAGSWASATSAATTAPRTRSTTRTSPTRGTPAPRSARAARCASSSRARAAAGRSTTSSTRPSARGRRRDTQPVPRVTVTADELVLSAGTLGTHVPAAAQPRGAARALAAARRGLLRQRRPADLRRPLHGERHGRRAGAAPIDAAYGPVITSAVRVPDELDGDGSAGRGFYIEDAGYPEFVSWMLQVARHAERARAGAADARARRAHAPRARATRTSAPRSRTCSATATCPPARCRCS